MTALLILAIAASSALVFTSRVELLKLAVIIALWAAVASAFVSVIYRRQSDVDQARARDLKLVYDLQLDREISARREYELTVESQLRRELASELRAQAADEVAALRNELSALRTNLEILFDADLTHRPALEPERTPVRAYSDWARSGEQPNTGATRVASSVSPSYPPNSVTETAENPIIDVPEVRIPPAAKPAPQPTYSAPQAPPAPATPMPPAEPRRGSHRRAAEEPPRRAPEEKPQPQPQPQPDAGRWAQPSQPFIAPEPRREPAPQPAPQSMPQPAPQPARAETPASAWKPVGAEGEWLPPGAPGSNWSADAPVERSRHGAPEPGVEKPARHGRHAEPGKPGEPGEPVAAPVNGTEPARQEGEGRRRARSRHATEPTAPAPAPAARHATGAETPAEGPSTGGQSVADLLARLQPTPGEGRRHRRRED